jgi:2-dehydro-3-deoxygluconokinase
MSDLVFVGLDEANALWGTSTAEQVRALLHDVPTVVVKDESHGATEFTAEGVVFVSTPFVEVVEAIGAGDAFAAGYLSAGLKGLGANERLAGGHERAQTVLGSTSDIPDVRKG